MRNTGNRQMKIGFIASVLAVTLTAGVAGSAFAGRPDPATSPRNPLQPVVTELNGIDMELASLLERQPSRDNFRGFVARLNALAKRIDQQESRVESVLAQAPVPLSADLTADLLTVLAAADAIVQDAQAGLALYSSDWPQESIDAVNGVEDAAQAVVNLIQDALGWQPT